MALTGLLTMAVAVVFQIMPFYNILHDHYDIHTEVCVMLVIGLYIIIVWTGDKNKANTGKQGTRISYSLSCHLFQSAFSLCVCLRDTIFLKILQCAFPGGRGSLLVVHCSCSVRQSSREIELNRTTPADRRLQCTHCIHQYHHWKSALYPIVLCNIAVQHCSCMLFCLHQCLFEKCNLDYV